MGDTTPGDVGVIIALKHLAAAKSRLSSMFPPAERRQVVLAMLLDTIAAARDVPEVGSITVVTPDPTAAAEVRNLGAVALADPTPPRHPDPLNNAILAAFAAIAPQFSDVVVLQGDLPALKPRELSEALADARRFDRSFVADRHGQGTVALFVCGAPADPRFGSGSAGRHRDSGAIELAGSWPGLRCDIDTPADLMRACQLGVGPATAVATEAIRPWQFTDFSH